jgi:hypothetical protein
VVGGGVGVRAWNEDGNGWWGGGGGVGNGRLVGGWEMVGEGNRGKGLGGGMG